TEEELFYLNEFLRNQLDLHLTELGPATEDPPDAWAAVTSSDQTISLLDFEMTEYSVDDSPGAKGGSPRRQLNGFWDKILGELIPRLREQRLPIDLRIWLKEPVTL